jgi:HAE1 family hydrophobic/amphiphilic exporter-1
MGASNTGFLFIKLKPKDQRKLTADGWVQMIRPKLNAVPGIRALPQNPPPIAVGGRLAKGQYQYTLQGSDMKELYAGALTLEEEIRKLDGFEDVASDLLIKSPQLNVKIMRDKASAYNVTAGQIEDALYYAYGARQVSTILAPTNQYQVIMELLPQFQMNPVDLSRLYVRSLTGQSVPLKAVADLVSDVGPLSVNHSGQLPSVTISFNLRPGVSLGDAVQRVNELARRILPAAISTSYQGTAQAFQTSFQSLPLLLVLAIVVIYMVLGILYESFIHPLTILTALPFAGFGALLTLLVFKTDLSLYAFVGIIMLVGLVKKNGIMMVDFAIAAQKEGKDPPEAIYTACLVRFRPIMMTTVAALMAALPIALGYGAGAESRQPLGLAVVGGLLFSQTLTLYVTPVFYVYMESLNRWLGRVFHRRPVPAPSPAE